MNEDNELKINGEHFITTRDIKLYDCEEAGKTHSIIKINGKIISLEEFRKNKTKLFKKSSKFRSQMSIIVDMKETKIIL